MNTIKRLSVAVSLLFAVAVMFSSCKKDPPVAAFSSSVDGLEVTFTNSTTGEVESYSWEFGDGETSSEQSPTHTYASAGDYEVTLTASGKKEDDAITKTVTVGSAGAATAPTPEFSGADGVLVAVKTSTFTESPGFPNPIETVIGTAVAVFPSGTTYIDAGDITCESKDLTKNSNNSYTYVPGMSDPTGISFTDDVHWTVAGANGIPAIDFTTDSIAFPSVDQITSSSTVTLSGSYMLTSDGVTGADSVLFILTDYAGNQAMATVAGSVASYNFSSAEMSSLESGGGIAQVAAYSFQMKDEGGKNIVYINEAVATDVQFTFE